MTRKKKVVVRNQAAFSRTFRDPETGGVVKLRPGLNELDGSTVERLMKGDARFRAQLDEDRPGGLSVERKDAMERLVKGLEAGDLSIRDIESPYDAIEAVGRIDEIPALLRLYRESNRVSVRSAIVRKLRRLGYEGT